MRTPREPALPSSAVRTASTASTASTAGPRGPGRPVDLTKRDDMAEAARRLFVAGGFEAVSMEGVAAEAGVSKVTVYRAFADRGGLLARVVERESERMAGALRALQVARAAPRDMLVAFGMRLMKHLSQPEVQAFDRHMAVQAARHPELARAFFEAGPGRIRAVLAELLAPWCTTPAAVPEELAEELMAAWAGAVPLELRFGLRRKAAPADVERRIQRVVARFMPELTARSLG